MKVPIVRRKVQAERIPEPVRAQLAALYGQAQQAQQRFQETLEIAVASLELHDCDLNLETGLITRKETKS
ncbi:MAG: hypothetical protein KGL39_12070 [Patescibacteria group bacterium]|nr:hypothetical protein [Patescibacteria group bacterium]